MAEPNLTPWADFEVGFVRKSDGKIVNVKIFDVAKRFCTADFVNNEIQINGETLIADSFRAPYHEVTLGVQKNCLHDGNGSYQIETEIFDTDQTFVVEKNSIVSLIPMPNQGCTIKSVVNENNVELFPVENVFSVEMEKDHVITITYDSK